MTDKQTYWMRDAEGAYALMTGADERDWWTPFGWTQAEEPGRQEFVWARHEGIENPARFPAGILATAWPGWEPSTPPSPMNPVNGEPLVPPVFTTPAAVAETKPSKTAAGGDAKEK